jgi:hypothetical protein
MSKVSIGNIPAEANSKGSLNESTPMAQRTPEGAPLGAGPDIRQVPGSANDTYFAPATYKTSRGMVRTDR